MEDTIGPEIEESIRNHASFEMRKPVFTEELYAMPPTRGQERFWSLDQMIPGNPALNMPLMWKCTGPLNVDMLCEAFTRVVERHESLRTTFKLVGGQLMQIIGPPWTVPIPIVNLSGEPEAEYSLRAKQLVKEHAAYRMDLLSGPLLVVNLLRFEDTNHLLLVTLHHIICDGVSTGVLLRDVATVYEALLEGKQPDLPELEIQLADFAIWQQGWRESPDYAASLDFWRRSLGTNFSRIQLRDDKQALQSGRISNNGQGGDIETLLLEPRLAESVHEFCRRNYITHNVLFLSVFSLLLHRITGQRDLLIGSPTANRTLQTENLVGMFMNIQAMRTKLEEGGTFKALVDKVQQWTLDAYENQQLPFEDIIYDTSFSSGSSSFELPVFFLYQRSFMVTHQIGGLTIEPLRSMSPGATFEIMFAVVDRVKEGPRLQLEYNPHKFQKETILKYLQLYVVLLEGALKNQTASLDTIGEPDESVSDVIVSPVIEASAAEMSETQSKYELIARHRTFRDAIEFQLVELWQTTLGIPYVSVDDEFFSLGVSSFSALRLITKINRVYSTNLGLATLFTATTIRAIASLIRDKLSPNMHSSVVPIQTAGTKTPLFLIHGIRGNILSYYGLAMHLGKDQPVYGIQAQALISGEPALLRIEDMASYYIAEMRRVQPAGPYNFLGYSFGGIVALEMAHQLRAAGQNVNLLGMLDSKSPEYMKSLLTYRASYDKTIQEERKVAGEANKLSYAESVKQIIEKIRARLIRVSCQIATRLNKKTIPSFMKDAWSINYVANSRYVPKPYDGRMTLFRAARQSDPRATADLGWAAMFRGGVDVRVLPGTHETLWSDQNVEEFATSLADSLKSEVDRKLLKAG